MNVLAVGALTLAVLVAFGTVASPRSHAAPEQSTDPWDGSTFTAPSSYSTSTDAVFSGVFKHSPPAPISSIVLHLAYSATDTPSAECRPAPSDQTYVPPDTTASTTTSTSIDPSTTTSIDPSTTTTAPQPPPNSSTVKFEFHVPFTCNGIYDATATANIEDPTGETAPPLHKTIGVVAVRIAVPPDPPASITATDDGNHTVTVSWAAPKAYAGAGHPPPDFVGYRVSRKDGAGGSFAAIGDTPATTLTFTDSALPASGGSFAYEVESVRTFATSTPVVTEGALTIGSPGASSAGGRSGGGRAAPDPGAGGTGTAYYDTTTLADEGDEPGGDALSGVRGGGAIQRFASQSGAGLVKPFAAALDLGVWASLLLFLTRRAAKAERAALLAVELENAP